MTVGRDTDRRSNGGDFCLRVRLCLQLRYPVYLLRSIMQISYFVLVFVVVGLLDVGLK